MHNKSQLHECHVNCSIPVYLGSVLTKTDLIICFRNKFINIILYSTNYLKMQTYTYCPSKNPHGLLQVDCVFRDDMGITIVQTKPNQGKPATVSNIRTPYGKEVPIKYEEAHLPQVIELVISPLIGFCYQYM